MAIGFDQLKNETPKVVKRIRDSLLFMISSSLVATPVLAPLFKISGEHYGIWCGVILILVKGISMMFGVDDEEALELAKKKIKAIEERQSSQG